ncbi:MAG: hypothetical protein HLUCCO17_10760 [Saliniramus fredricksonii]|uniref:Uncharacterized protein n=1 Tax=Saliniramus fredricksonii TaxID=1653334 RepID=A0A0P7XSJ7_9HYPH|nr:hypothetical protein [Saliniramus fredricksonii]KPQ10537.1 MAG: hypothetical protein HLUCCO17_10760 [Saliniramus fredricksonii]SCC79949.1 hypothetical protein GA0071312_1258 [Saliniramus fredricksonii]
MVLRALYWIPIFGWLLRDAVHGDTLSRILFVVNLLVLWALAVMIFGYAAIIIPALLLTPTILAIIVVFTLGR